MKVTARGKILPPGCEEMELECEFYKYPARLEEAQKKGWVLRWIKIKWPPHPLTAKLKLYKFPPLDPCPKP